MKTIQFKYETPDPENLNELNQFLMEHPMRELHLQECNGYLCKTQTFSPDTRQLTSTSFTYGLNSIVLSVQESQENEEGLVYHAAMFAIRSELSHEQVIELWRQMNPQYVIRISSISCFEEDNMNGYLLFYHLKQE